MNKALEVIEARWLFGLEPDQIEVVVHPESIVHSMVEFVDGSVLAQLSPPDMRLPIQLALTYPDRVPGPCPLLDLTRAMALHFRAARPRHVPGLDLGFEVMRRAGTAGAALNAANEAAVARFLAGEIGFLDIPRACRSALDHHPFDPRPTLDALWRVDAWARQEVGRWKRDLRLDDPQGGPRPGLRDLYPRARPLPPRQVERREGGEILDRLRADPRLVPAGVGLRIGTGSRPPGRATPLPGARPNTSWPPSRWAATSRCSARATRRRPRKRSPVDRPPGLPQQVGLGPDADHHRRRDHERDPRRGLLHLRLHPGDASRQPAKIGWVLPGAPAYKAGLRVGDEIVAIDGRRDVGFKELLGRVNMSGAGQKINFTIKRAGTGTERGRRDRAPPRRLEPGADHRHPLLAHGLELNPKPPSRPCPARRSTRSRARPSASRPKTRSWPSAPKAARSSRSRTRADFWTASLEKLRDRPLVVEVERKKPEGGGPTTLAKVTVPRTSSSTSASNSPSGPIAAIRPGSPAEKAA